MIGISITKETDWRGHAEQFSNVYHYDTADNISASLARQLVDLIVEAEQFVHSGSVRFVEARVWGAGGTPQENETIGIFSLNSVGVAAEESRMDREACYLVEWKTTRPSATGRPVTLKKWIHSCSLFGSTNGGPLAGTEKIPAAARTALSTYANSVKTLNTPSISGGLIAPSGSGRRAQDGYIYDYIEHHEFT